MQFAKKSNKKNLSREELITLAQQDDYHALEELIKREQKRVYSAFYYLTPDSNNLLDLTQEALLRMAKNIKRLREPNKFQSWFNQIISNIFYDEMRKHKKNPQTLSIDTEPTEDTNVININEIRDLKKSPLENTISGELNTKIINAIHNLPNQFRIAIVLRELQGLSYEEIAEITNTSVGTIKSRIARARGKLQEQLKPYLTQ